MEHFRKKEYEQVVKAVGDLIVNNDPINDITWGKYLQAMNHLCQFEDVLTRFKVLLAEYGASMWRYDRMDLVHSAIFAAKALRRGDLALMIVQESRRHGAMYLQCRHYFDAMWANSIVLIPGKGYSDLPRYKPAPLQNALAIARLAAEDGYIMPPHAWFELTKASIHYNHPSEDILALTAMLAKHTPTMLPNAKTLFRALSAPMHARRHELSVQMFRLWVPHLPRYSAEDASRLCEVVLKPLCRLGMAPKALLRSHAQGTTSDPVLSQAACLAMVSEIVDTMVRNKIRMRSHVLREFYLPLVVPSLSAPLFLAHVKSSSPYTLELNAYVLHVALREYVVRGQVDSVNVLLQTALTHDIEVTWSTIDLILAMFTRVGAYYDTTALVETILGDDDDIVDDVGSSNTGDTAVKDTLTEDAVPDFVYRQAMHAYMESYRYEAADAFYKRHLGKRHDEFAKSMALVAAAARRLQERVVDASAIPVAPPTNLFTSKPAQA
ncbi:hypothetical protein DYB32_002088 [Aphanomyces invadans]|uniref:Pentacotripeptide-repeat region of PRORP domain-containing protein n=1 Tax=Aphanomyces invadans TaxID=157072 RepID=A0A3R6W279_9STRA|nr:hypothetical protein DYB32_002088 [Aphanomyces invadans]